jgi:hypothetical protein
MWGSVQTVLVRIVILHPNHTQFGVALMLLQILLVVLTALTAMHVSAHKVRAIASPSDPSRYAYASVS